MTYHFRDAIKTEAKPLVGLYAESNGGKTYSALLLAKGFAGDMKHVGMIETEAGRGEAWAEDPLVGGYKVLPIRGEFSPLNYGKAISAAEQANLKVLIVDSASHEWEGAGGVLSMAADNQLAGKKGPLVWQQPKMQHQREFMLRLLGTSIPLVIVCMRAKYPMYEVTQRHLEKWEAAGRPGGKPPKVGEWARSWELEPKQSDDILFEMFIHGWLDKEKHLFHGTKYTLDELRQVIPDGQLITVETGQRLARWAAGSKTAGAGKKGSSFDDEGERITPDQATELEAMCTDNDIQVADFKKKAGVERFDDVLASDFAGAKKWIQKEAAKRKEAAAA